MSSEEIVHLSSLKQMFTKFFELSHVCQMIIFLSLVKILCYDRENDSLGIIQCHFLA